MVGTGSASLRRWYNLGSRGVAEKRSPVAHDGDAEDGSGRSNEELRWLEERVKEIRRHARIKRIADVILNLGWSYLSESERFSLETNADFEEAVMGLLRERRSQEAAAQEWARRAREDEKILARKRPTLSIRQSKGFRHSTKDASLEAGAILVVDDIEADLDTLCQFLSKAHLPVHRATNMEDALHILQRQPISMLITDILLPMYRLTREEYTEWEQSPTTRHDLLKLGVIMENVRVTRTREVKKETTDYSQFAGFKLLDEARKLIPWLPVIIVSRYADLNMARRAMESQVQAILSKQAHLRSPDELLTSVRKNMVPIDRRIASLGRDGLSQFLATASEQTVTLKVLVPLFHKLGYRGIRYTHGTNECGLDLVFYDVDRLGIRRYMGAQVKAEKIHKSVGDSTTGSVLAILQQVEQAFQSTLYLLPERTELELERIFVISSKSVTQPARDYIRKALMGRVYPQHVDFWDAETIVDLISKTQGS